MRAASSVKNEMVKQQYINQLNSCGVHQCDGQPLEDLHPIELRKMLAVQKAIRQ